RSADIGSGLGVAPNPALKVDRKRSRPSGFWVGTKTTTALAIQPCTAGSREASRWRAAAMEASAGLISLPWTEYIIQTMTGMSAMMASAWAREVRRGSARARLLDLIWSRRAMLRAEPTAAQKVGRPSWVRAYSPITTRSGA